MLYLSRLQVAEVRHALLFQCRRCVGIVGGVNFCRVLHLALFCDKSTDRRDTAFCRILVSPFLETTLFHLVLDLYIPSIVRQICTSFASYFTVCYRKTL